MPDAATAGWPVYRTTWVGRRPSGAQRRRVWVHGERISCWEKPDRQRAVGERHDAAGTARGPVQVEIVRGIPKPANERGGKYRPRITRYIARLATIAGGEPRTATIELWTSENDDTRRRDRASIEEWLRDAMGSRTSGWRGDWALHHGRGHQRLEIQGSNARAGLTERLAEELLRAHRNGRVTPSLRQIRIPGTGVR